MHRENEREVTVWDTRGRRSGAMEIKEHKSADK